MKATWIMETWARANQNDRQAIAEQGKSMAFI